MKSRTIVFAVLALFAGLAMTPLILAQEKSPAPMAKSDAPNAHEAPDAIERAILAQYDKMTAAAEALNPDGLYSNVLDTDRGSLIANGHLFLTRQAALENTRAGFVGLKSLKYRFSERRVMTLSPTLAVLMVVGSAEAMTDEGRSISNSFAQSVVFVLRDGQWRVAHAHHSNPIAR